MRPYYLAQLAALCDQYPIEHKVVFVPSSQIGSNLITALALSGQDWLNLETVAPHDLALRQVEGRMRVANLKPLEPDRALLCLETMLEATVQEYPGGYLAGMTLSPGLTRSFLRSLQALRNADVTSAVLDGADLQPAKRTLLSELYRRYSLWLETEGVADEARVFEMAMEVLGEESEGDGDTVYAILDDTSLPALAYKYVARLVGGLLYRIGRPEYGTAIPAGAAATRFPDAPYPRTDRMLVGPGGRLLSGGLTPADAHGVKLRRALGAENEVRGILREMLHRQMPLDTVEIVYTTESPYLGLIYDAVERFGIPAAFATGIPVALTRPGQALTGFYRWIGSGFDATELVSLCRSGHVTFNNILDRDDPLEPYQLATLLLRERVTRGREAYDNMLGRIEQRRDRQPENLGAADTRNVDEPDMAFLQSVRRTINALFGLIPAGFQPEIKAVTAMSVQFLERFAPTRSDTDSTAKHSLVDRLNEIGAAVKKQEPLARLTQRLGELLKDHKIGASTARPGHLYVVPLDRAAYAHRSRLYVVGMDEGVFPGGATEDPVLLDDEKAGLSGELRLQRSRPGEQVWHLIRVLGMATDEVTLLANGRNLADGREIYPSPLFLQAANQLTGGHPEQIPVLSSVPDPEMALDDVEAMLAVRDYGDFAQSMDAGFPWLAEGADVMRERSSPRLTRFDGWVSAPLPRLGITDGTTAMSASRLETLSMCPYRYFLRYVLHVEPPQEPTLDPTRWLDPLEFGSLLHDLFRALMQTLHVRGERPDATRHAELMADLLDKTIKAYRERIPVLHQAAFHADRARLIAAAQVFLAAESNRSHADPVGFEVSFGFGEQEGLSHPESVTLRLSDRINLSLRGRIDRVDRVAGGYEIWDYKTGSATTFSDHDLLNHGLHLQWVLYAQALERILETRGDAGRVRQSGYFFVSDREHGRRIGDAPPAPAEVGQLLEPLFDLVARGGFFRIIQGEPCTFCDYAHVCKTDPRIRKSNVREVTMENEPEIISDLHRWINV